MSANKRPRLTFDSKYFSKPSTVDVEDSVARKKAKPLGDPENGSQGSNASQESIPESQGSSLKAVMAASNAKMSSEMFVDKYKPKSCREILGQSGDKSNVSKLLAWLRNWHGNREKEKSGEKSKKKPMGRYGDDDGSSYKAVLLSGPPGIGKTTSAQLACQEAGFVYKEYNASNTRNKKSLESEVATLMSNMVLTGYFNRQPKMDTKMKSKHVLIMDEVDGMAGNEDRGGVAELIRLIKETKIPIICICNDRAHPKIRSLTNYCYDLRFYKPQMPTIKNALKSIAAKEGISINDAAIDEIIISSNQDIRQSINYLNMLSAKKVTISKTLSKQPMKDVHLGPFDAIKKVFPTGFDASKNATLAQRCDLFFHDYNLMPLMVFENYTKTTHPATRRSDVDKLRALVRTADSLSFGDLIEKNIRTFNNWSMLPHQAVFSVAAPSIYMSSQLQSLAMFPSFLGKTSNINKRDRLLQELKTHMNLKISGTKSSLSLDYLGIMRDTIINHLKAGNVDKTVEFLESYYLKKEDLDSIMELAGFAKDVDPFSKIDSKTKAALTRAINKSDVLLPYVYGEQFKKITKGKGKASAASKKKASIDDDADEDDEMDVEEEEVLPFFD